MSTPSSSYHHYYNHRSFEGGGSVRLQRGATDGVDNDDSGHGTSTTPIAGIGKNLQHSHEAQIRAIQRINQVKDEQAHRDVVDQKMADLLSTKLEVLRNYVYEIEADNWKYEQRK